MAEEKKRIPPLLVGAGVAAGAAALLAIYALTRKPGPPPPPPGLANLYGVVVDADTGMPIPDVRALLDSLETYTDEGGNYSFEDIEPGEYVLQFSKEGYETITY